MRLILGASLILGFILSGCATSGNVGAPDPEIARLQNKVDVLESELRQEQGDNLILKEKIAELDKKPFKLPTGKDIQTALKNAGFYKGDVDGQIGSKTKQAIKKFQEANGLNPDGAVGSRTWEKLEKHLSTH